MGGAGSVTVSGPTVCSLNVETATPASCQVLPELSPLTRYSAGSGLTVVKLVD